MLRTIIGILVGAQMSVAPLLAQKSVDSRGRKPSPAKSARSQKPVTGSGIIFVEVDYQTGRVTAARMLKSTGSPILDNAAVTAFRKAKFKPKTISPVKVPIKFTLTGVRQ